MALRPPRANTVQKEATYSHNTKSGMCFFILNSKK
uniref:Uncharacterized protein n=1 Tax=Anguilla anguilla TaxID=7936 RepID=A0A0E9VTV1_ANGAN